MTTLLVCITIAIFIPQMLAFASIRYRLQQFGKIDIKQPRVQASELSDGGHRAVAAQNNAWEALALFLAAIVMASIAGVPAAELSTPAIVFIVSRLAHAVFYLSDRAPLRTLSFLAAFGSVMWIVVKAFSV